MDTQTQIDRLIELAIVQRSDLKKLISELPQLREHLSAEIERIFEDSEPQIRAELEDWTTKQAKDETAKLGSQLEAKLISLSKSLEATTQARYNAIMAERAQNIDLAKKAEDKLAEVAQAIPVQVKQIVTDELSRFPRAGEIDQLRKEFAEPRGLNPRGRWEPGATYYKLDLVAYNGDSYVANEETSEKPNRNSSKWTLNAARGQAGGGGFITPAQGDYTASMITNVPAGVITSTNVQDAINELAADVDVSQNTLDALVTNAESVAITKGQVVYAFGATGNRMSVKRALNTGDATSAKTIGVVLDSSIAAGATGNIRCVGVVDGLTLGSYTEGDTVYLGATAGSITATKPYAPNHLVYVGIVERANNGNGELYVKIQNGYELDEIHDVQITSAPLAGALLMRDATNSLWKANRLTGTTNQVTVTNADTAVTLSLPTSLASVDSVTASTSTALTLSGGSSGASLVLGSGVNGSVNVNPKGTGSFVVGSAGLTNTFTTSIYGASALNLVGIGANTTVGLIGAYSAASAPISLAMQTAGGNLLIGTTTDMSGSGGLKIAGTTAATNTTSGALQVGSNIGLSGNAGGASYFGGNLYTTSTTPLVGIGTTNPLGAIPFFQGGSGMEIKGTGATSLAISGTVPALWFYRTGGGVDQKSYALVANSTSLSLTSLTDAGSTRRTFLDANTNTGLVTLGEATSGISVPGSIFGGGSITLTSAGVGGPNLNFDSTNATVANRYNGTTYRSGGTDQWVHGLRQGDGKFHLYDIVRDVSAITVSPGPSAGVAGTVAIPSTIASTTAASGALVVTGGVGVGGTSVFGSTVNSLGYVLNRTNNSGHYTGTSDNYGFTWTGTNGEMSTATGSMIFKPAATTSLTLTSTAATFAGAVTIAGTVIHTLSATPASASATGTVGTMSWDANYIYICTAANTWKRVAIATW